MVARGRFRFPAPAYSEEASGSGNPPAVAAVPGGASLSFYTLL